MSARKAKELQSNPLRASRTYKPRDGATHSWAWSAMKELSTRHRFVSLTVDGNKVIVRAYD